MLATMGSAFLCLPTYREIQRIRLHARHEVGGGSSGGRAATRLLLALTGGFTCVETLLPFRNGPFYVTACMAPIILGLILAEPIASLLAS